MKEIEDRMKKRRKQHRMLAISLGNFTQQVALNSGNEVLEIMRKVMITGKFYSTGCLEQGI